MDGTPINEVFIKNFSKWHIYDPKYYCSSSNKCAIIDFMFIIIKKPIYKHINEWNFNRKKSSKSWRPKMEQKSKSRQKIIRVLLKN